MAGSLREALEGAGFEAPPELTAPGRLPPSCIADEAGIAADAIAPGVAVLRFDARLLVHDGEVVHTPEAVALSVCPFVCVAVEGDESTWTVVSSRPGVDRLMIEPEWRSGGNYRWRRGQLFLANGAALWRGPRRTFAVAAWRDSLNGTAEQARLTPDGLDAVRARIEADGGFRLL